MKFTLVSPDLHILAETGRDIAELCAHFRLPIEQHIDDLVAGAMPYVVSGAKRPWFELGAATDAAANVPFEFLQPYYDRLKQITGYDGAPFHVSDWRLRYGRNQNLCHTHIVTDAFIDKDGYHAHGFQQSQDWDGKTAEQRAPVLFNGYLREHLGHTKSEPQYLHVGSGDMLRPNPNYLKRHAPQPAATSEAVFEVIFGAWLYTAASDKQRRFYDEAETCHRTVVKTCSLAASLMKTTREFHTENYAKVTTFEQFKEMGRA